jgi:GMP synthase-like glutamine amidotransferase
VLVKKKKRVLALQHEADDPPGHLGEIMQQHGIECEVVHVEESGPLPDVETFQAVLALGGPQHVGDDVTYPYFVPEYALIQRAVQKDIPYLGICLGGQLLAHALGAPVTSHEQTELGLVRVEFTEAGKADPLYQGLPGQQWVFEWHEDVFAMPPEAVRLATNAHTLNQAFRFGRRAYGLQYHIELTPELFQHWMEKWKNEMMAVLGPEGPERLARVGAEVLPTYQEQSRRLFENFLTLSNLL